MPLPFAPRGARSYPFAAAVAALLMFAAGAHAAPPGFAFLEIPTGARSVAMGGALATLSQGAEAMYANPASLLPPHDMEISAGHSEMIESLRHDYFAVSGPLWGGALGASMRALYSEPIDERDVDGNLIGSFGAHDLEFALGYGVQVAPGMHWGLSAQAYRERIANQAANTYGVSAGATWEPAQWNGLRLAGAVQNVGPPGHYSFDGEQGAPVGLPAAFQGGASYSVAAGGRENLRAALETRLTRGRSGIGIAGVELADASGMALRAGLRLNDDASNFSVGAGYVTKGLRLDYAFVPFKLDLGDTHRFSLTASF